MSKINALNFGLDADEDGDYDDDREVVECDGDGDNNVGKQILSAIEVGVDICECPAEDLAEAKRWLRAIWRRVGVDDIEDY